MVYLIARIVVVMGWVVYRKLLNGLKGVAIKHAVLPLYADVQAYC